MRLVGSSVPIGDITGASALRLARNLLTLPALAFIPIHPSDFTTTREAEISTQLLISQEVGGKEYITDNIAPGPRYWKINGYISGIPYAELTNWFMPSLLLQKLVIDTAYKSRKPVIFRTTDGEVVNVLIKQCVFIEEADNMNTVKISALVQEYNFLTVKSSVNTSGTDEAAGLSTPKSGFISGLALAGGLAAATLVGVLVKEIL